MPPKAKFTREEIVAAALEIVQTQGMDALTSRGLGAKLGSSARPIFTVFQSMDEVLQEVMAAAQGLYQRCLQQESPYPPYKASGMAYIQFAREEKELFRLLFMRDRSGEAISENREEIRPQLELIMQNLGLSEDEAFLFHIELWIFVHGIATMLVTAYLDWDMEFVSQALTDVYQGLKHRYTGGK